MTTMRTALAALLLAPALASAQSGPSIVLDSINTDGADVTGTCGAAQVAIDGIRAGEEQHIDGFEGSITITAGGKTLRADKDSGGTIPMENFAQVHCVATPNGARLVVAAHCASSYCLPINYTVIDPATAEIVSVGDGEWGCDGACAEKALGTQLPAAIRGMQYN